MTEHVLQLVTPDSCDRDLHDQLTSEKGRDKVHPLSSVEDLIRFRLGYSGWSKQCFALLDNSGNPSDRRILSAIYTHWSSPDDSELPGQVDRILAEESAPLQSPATVVTFYSISSFARGAGESLIKALHTKFAEASQSPKLTTLSPLRTLAQWLSEPEQQTINFDQLDEEARRAIVARYLSEFKDPVQQFHLANGAQVGGIRPDANAPGTADFERGSGFMVNYLYPRKPERLVENRGILAEGRLPVSYHLESYFPKRG